MQFFVFARNHRKNPPGFQIHLTKMFYGQFDVGLHDLRGDTDFPFSKTAPIRRTFRSAAQKQPVKAVIQSSQLPSERNPFGALYSLQFNPSNPKLLLPRVTSHSFLSVYGLYVVASWIKICIKQCLLFQVSQSFSIQRVDIKTQRDIPGFSKVYVILLSSILLQ